MLYAPAIIIGAPRSGTNMLRDALTSLSGVATWPCDEINYIWRHGNVRHPSDEFTADLARPEVGLYVRRQFDWVARRYRVHTVVEKTCANSLRVPFVNAIIPDAKYVFIRRDGLDAVGSAMQRWTAKLDIPYIARKARFVPPSDLPYYASRYLWSHLHRFVSRERRLALWGPQLDDMQDLLAQHLLEDVCAIQWQRCVEASAAAFARMPNGQYLEVAYESFVRDPATELGRVTNFLGLNVGNDALRRAVDGVNDRSLGKGRRSLSVESKQRIQQLVDDTLRRYGYA